MDTDDYDYYERQFNLDVIDKKRTARGIHNRASRKKGFKGAVRTPSDFLTNKQRKALNSEVRISSMYDKYKDVENLPTKAELKAMSYGNPEECKKILEVAKAHNSGIKIQKAVGLSAGGLYDLYKRVGVPYNKGVRGGDVKSDKKNIEKPLAKTNENDVELLERVKKLEELITIEHQSPAVSKCFSMKITGEYSKKEIEDRILSLSQIMLDDSKYKFTLTIEEV